MRIFFARYSSPIADMFWIPCNQFPEIVEMINLTAWIVALGIVLRVKWGAMGDRNKLLKKQRINLSLRWGRMITDLHRSRSQRTLCHEVEEEWGLACWEIQICDCDSEILLWDALLEGLMKSLASMGPKPVSLEIKVKPISIIQCFARRLFGTIRPFVKRGWAVVNVHIVRF